MDKLSRFEQLVESVREDLEALPTILTEEVASTYVAEANKANAQLLGPSKIVGDAVVADPSGEPLHVLPVRDLEKGQLSSPGPKFCPIIAVSKYPYKYVGKRHSETVAKKYFNEGKFWRREWDLYYAWTLEDDPKAVILTPEPDVEAFLSQIESDFPQFAAQLPDLQDLEVSFAFPSHPRLVPRYLGRSATRDQYLELERSTPPSSFRISGEATPSQGPDNQSLESFKSTMEEIMESNKNKSKEHKARKKQERIMRQQNMIRQLKRLQRYLGLRPTNVEHTIIKSEIPWPEMQAALERHRQASQIPPLDTEEQVKFAMDGSVVFIAFDVEAYERDNNKITEIGVSVLDTLDLAGVPPGKDGTNWHAKIRTRHLRIKENKHLENKEFVQGCANRFEFGQSEFVSLKDVPMILAACFRPPYFAGPDSPNYNSSVKRNLILLGHNINADISYLHRIGYNPLNLSTVLECLDTSILDRVWRRDINQRSLGAILYELGLPSWNLHNAGNDAHYTLQTMVSLAVRTIAEKGERTEEGKAAALDQKVGEAMKLAKERVLENAEGWSTDGEGEDGGMPVKTGGTRR